MMKSVPACDFCGKTCHEVESLIAGPNVHICNECVVLCAEILDGKAEKIVEDDSTAK